MLRRVARVFRIGLLLLGLVIVVWLPISFFFSVWLSSPWPAQGMLLSSGDGVLWGNVLMKSSFPVEGSFEVWVRRNINRAAIDEALTLPRAGHTENPYGFTMWDAVLPLWLLAFLCLAWPVTSFIIARKRKGRGFEVEPTGTSNIEHPTSNIEAP